jgi:hypothetical protein
MKAFVHTVIRMNFQSVPLIKEDSFARCCNHKTQHRGLKLQSAYNTQDAHRPGYMPQWQLTTHGHDNTGSSQKTIP